MELFFVLVGIIALPCILSNRNMAASQLCFPVVLPHICNFTFFISSRVTSGDSEFFVYFSGTDRGEIYKIARWKSSEGQWRSRLLDVIEGVGAGGAAIR